MPLAQFVPEDVPLYGLQAQGLNEDASRFAYRAQTLERAVLRHMVGQPVIMIIMVTFGLAIRFLDF